MAYAYSDVNATEIKRALGENVDESESGEATTADSRQSDGDATTLIPNTVPGEDNAQDTLNPPTSRYTMDKKKLKKRVFPCPVCGEGADGSHQCGDCYAHVHVICGKPYEGSPEGFGQLQCCGKCMSVPDEEEFTQVWSEPASNAGTQENVQISQEKAEVEREALAQFLGNLPLVHSSATTTKPTGVRLSVKLKEKGARWKY
jgi:hypothetical protein